MRTSRMTDRSLPCVGVSRCLLGDEVRHDGGHKRDANVVDEIGKLVIWEPVCPEVELDLGVPREPVHLTGDPRKPRMIVTATEEDITSGMRDLSRRRVSALLAMPVHGYILKAKSPSCGLRDASIRRGETITPGAGVFAAELLARAPLLPIVDEKDLELANGRSRFIERVSAYRVWRQQLASGQPIEKLRHLATRVGPAPAATLERLAAAFERHGTRQPDSLPDEAIGKIEQELATLEDAWHDIERALLTSR